MAGAITALAANLNPGEWSKDVSPEKNLKTFNRYITRFEHWINVCEMENFTDKQKWNLMIATGGNNLEDLIVHQVETRQQNAVLAVVANPGAQPPVLARAKTKGIVPTPWDEGLELCRTAISRYTNQVMARNKLLSEMPATDYSDWRKLGQELLKQAKRCLWDDYGFEQAALDALLYQCPEVGWKTKILMGKMNFQKALGHWTCDGKEQGKQLIGLENGKTEIPINRVKEEKRKWDCWQCFEDHERVNCPAYGYNH